MTPTFLYWVHYIFLLLSRLNYFIETGIISCSYTHEKESIRFVLNRKIYDDIALTNKTPQHASHITIHSISKYVNLPFF